MEHLDSKHYLLKCQIFAALVALGRWTLQGGEPFGKQTDDKLLILMIKANSHHSILIAHEDIATAIAGLALVFFKGKGLTG